MTSTEFLFTLAAGSWQVPDVTVLDELKVEQHNLLIVLDGDSLVHTVESKGKYRPFNI